MHRSPLADRLIWRMQSGRLQAGLVLASLVVLGVMPGITPGLLSQQTGAGAPAGISHMGVVGIRSPAFSGAPRIVTPPTVLPSPNHAQPDQAAPIGRAGHWPSWEGGVAPGSEVHAGNGGQRGSTHGGHEHDGNGHGNHARDGYPYVYPGLLSFGYGIPAGNSIASGYSGYDEGGVSGPGPEAVNADGNENAGVAADPQMTENATQLYRPLYRGPAGSNIGPHLPGAPSTAPVRDQPAAQPATTLVFKDGRANQLVHNYALTGATLWALDGDTRREIPLDTLDLPATIKANRAAGVDFSLPSSR